jgi:hypothetical protein
MVKFEHTLFALPFAFLGMLLAAALFHAAMLALLARLDAAFFTANGVLAVWLFAATAVDVLA